MQEKHFYPNASVAQAPEPAGVRAAQRSQWPEWDSTKAWTSQLPGGPELGRPRDPRCPLPCKVGFYKQVTEGQTRASDVQ